MVDCKLLEIGQLDMGFFRVGNFQQSKIYHKHDNKIKPCVKFVRVYKSEE